MLNQLHSLTSLFLFILFVEGVWIYVGMHVCVWGGCRCVHVYRVQRLTTWASSLVTLGFGFLLNLQLTNCLV